MMLPELRSQDVFIQETASSENAKSFCQKSASLSTIAVQGIKGGQPLNRVVIRTPARC